MIFPGVLCYDAFKIYVVTIIIKVKTKYPKLINVVCRRNSSDVLFLLRSPNNISNPRQNTLACSNDIICLTKYCPTQITHHSPLIEFTLQFSRMLCSLYLLPALENIKEG